MKKLFSRSGADRSVTPSPACDPLLDDFPRGVEGRLKRDSWQPRNFLENTNEIALNVFEDNSRHIFLGAVHGHTIDIPCDDGRIERATLDGSLVGVNDDRHLLTVAGSRSGKGRSAIIPNLLSYGGSMLVIDPKGENANCTARYRAEILGQKVYVLDPFRITRSDLRRYRKAYNPMTILNLKSPTLVEDAGLIADSLIVPGDGKDQHWDYSAKAFVESLILHVATDSEAFLPEQRHLGMVSDLLISKRKPLGDTLSDMLSNPLAGRRVVAAAQAMIDKPDDERGSIISTAQRNLKFLDYDAIRASVDDHEFNLDELHAGKTTIYLCLPAMRLGTCRGWLRLFINLLLATVERAPKKPEVPILAILDEFAVLGYMKEIERAKKARSAHSGHFGRICRARLHEGDRGRRRSNRGSWRKALADPARLRAAQVTV